jgi:MFS family permease
MWVPAITCFACIPGYIAFLQSDTWQIWGAGLGIAAFFHLGYMGPIYAAVVTIAPPAMRAVAISILVLFTGLVGQVFGPLIVGVLNDALAATYGDEAIRYSMLVAVVTSLLGGLCFMAAPIGKTAEI